MTTAKVRPGDATADAGADAEATVGGMAADIRSVARANARTLERQGDDQVGGANAPELFGAEVVAHAKVRSDAEPGVEETIGLEIGGHGRGKSEVEAGMAAVAAVAAAASAAAAVAAAEAADAAQAEVEHYQSVVRSTMKQFTYLLAAVLAAIAVIVVFGFVISFGGAT